MHPGGSAVGVAQRHVSERGRRRGRGSGDRDATGCGDGQSSSDNTAAHERMAHRTLRKTATVAGRNGREAARARLIDGEPAHMVVTARSCPQTAATTL